MANPIPEDRVADERRKMVAHQDATYGLTRDAIRWRFARKVLVIGIVLLFWLLLGLLAWTRNLIRT